MSEFLARPAGIANRQPCVGLRVVEDSGMRAVWRSSDPAIMDALQQLTDGPQVRNFHGKVLGPGPAELEHAPTLRDQPRPRSELIKRYPSEQADIPSIEPQVVPIAGFHYVGRPARARVNTDSTAGSFNNAYVGKAMQRSIHLHTLTRWQPDGQLQGIP